jgi:hypothetical protein
MDNCGTSVWKIMRTNLLLIAETLKKFPLRRGSKFLRPFIVMRTQHPSLMISSTTKNVKKRKKGKNNPTSYQV